MKRHFLTPILVLLDEMNVWDERVEQIQMEADRNPEKYPRCSRRRREYREARTAFEKAHPDLCNALDSILSLFGSYMTEISVETYKQGGADLYSLLRQLESMGSPSVAEAESDV